LLQEFTDSRLDSIARLRAMHRDLSASVHDAG
jgi:hypothetical protein